MWHFCVALCENILFLDSFHRDEDVEVACFTVEVVEHIIESIISLMFEGGSLNRAPADFNDMRGLEKDSDSIVLRVSQL